MVVVQCAGLGIDGRGVVKPGSSVKVVPVEPIDCDQMLHAHRVRDRVCSVYGRTGGEVRVGIRSTVQVSLMHAVMADLACQVSRKGC